MTTLRDFSAAVTDSNDIRQAEEHNICCWAAGFLTGLAATRTSGAETVNANNRCCL